MRLSKKMFRIILSTTDKPITPQALKKFIPDSFIQNQLNLTLPEYNKIKVFTPSQTAIIINYLSIQSDDLQELFTQPPKPTTNQTTQTAA